MEGSTGGTGHSAERSSWPDLHEAGSRTCEGWGMKRGTCDGRATEGWTGGYCQECDNARRAANGKAFRTGIPVVEPKPMTPHERAASQRPVPPIPQAPKGSGNGRGRRQGDGGGRGRNGGRNGGRRERAANAA